MTRLYLSILLSLMGCGQAEADGSLRNESLYGGTANYSTSMTGYAQGALVNIVSDMQNATGDKFMEKGTSADISIFYHFGVLPPRILGEALSSVGHCDVTLSPDLNADPYNVVPGGFDLTDLSMIIRHETGHCFGMQHLPENNEVMFWEYHPELQKNLTSINRFISELTQSRKTYKH